MGTLFKNGTIVNAAETIQADILVEGEQIVLIGKNLPKIMIGWQIGLNDFAPVYGVYLPLDHTPNPPLTIFGDRVYLIALRLFGEKVIAETITIVTRESILGADPDLSFVIAENAQTGITGQPIVHGITGEMLTVKTRDSANGRNPQVPLLILAQCIGLRLDEAMFYIQIDEVVLLRPYSRQ